MTITTVMVSGLLNSTAYNELYDQLRKINYDYRHKVGSTIFDINKEYIFIGKSGTVTVSFVETDMV